MMTEVSDEQAKRAAIEFLSHKGEKPYRVTRRGAELWEDYVPAMRAALTAALAARPKVKALEWEDGGAEVTPLYYASTIAALVAERDALAKAYDSEKTASAHYRDLATRKSNEKIAEMRRAEAAERERGEAREAMLRQCIQITKDVIAEQYRKSGYAENLHTYSMIIEGAYEVKIRLEAATPSNAHFDRVTAAESALATANARVAELDDALTKLVAAFDHARMVPSRGAGGMTIEANIKSSVYHGVPVWPVEEARAALTGGENEK